MEGTRPGHTAIQQQGEDRNRALAIYAALSVYQASYRECNRERGIVHCEGDFDLTGKRHVKGHGQTMGGAPPKDQDEGLCKPRGLPDHPWEEVKEGLLEEVSSEMTQMRRAGPRGHSHKQL